MRIFSENVAEWQIEAVKKYAKKLKEEEIEHSALTPAEKDEQKRLWKQWIDLKKIILVKECDITSVKIPKLFVVL